MKDTIGRELKHVWIVRFAPGRKYHISGDDHFSACGIASKQPDQKKSMKIGYVVYKPVHSLHLCNGNFRGIVRVPLYVSQFCKHCANLLWRTKWEDKPLFYFKEKVL